MRVPLPAAMMTMSNAMKVPVSNRWKAWIIVMLLPLLLGGCSALRLSYGQGPLLAYWWLDGLVDLQDTSYLDSSALGMPPTPPAGNPMLRTSSSRKRMA